MIKNIIIAVCILVTLFFVVFANIQTSLAMEKNALANELAENNKALRQKAEVMEAEILLLQEALEACKAPQE